MKPSRTVARLAGAVEGNAAFGPPCPLRCGGESVAPDAGAAGVVGATDTGTDEELPDGNDWSAPVVLEEMSHAMEASVAQLRVDVLGIGDGMGSGDEGADLHRAPRQQVEEALEVASLGPAHVAHGVVDALQLIAVVVAPGTVGA